MRFNTLFALTQLRVFLVRCRMVTNVDSIEFVADRHPDSR